MEVVVFVEVGKFLLLVLDKVLFYGSFLGGVWFKVEIESGDCKYIVKFFFSIDIYDVVKVEYVVMCLVVEFGLWVVLV